MAEWLAAAGDIADAYVSNRRGDDPTIRHRIVIVTKADDEPSHLVHAPSVGTSGWYSRWAAGRGLNDFGPYEKR